MVQTNEYKGKKILKGSLLIPFIAFLLSFVLSETLQMINWLSASLALFSCAVYSVTFYKSLNAVLFTYMLTTVLRVVFLLSAVYLLKFDHMASLLATVFVVSYHFLEMAIVAINNENQNQFKEALA